MKFFLSLVCTLISFLGIVQYVQAQEAAIQQNGDFGQLSLQINTPIPIFVPLEPIPVIFTLENTTTASIPGHAAFDLNAPYLNIFVQKPDGSIQRMTPLSPFQARLFVKNGLLPPGAKIIKTEVLTFELDKYFIEPGQYKIKAVFKSLDGAQNINSNWLSFSIAQLTGANISAYNFLKAQKNLSTILFSVDNEEQTRFLERFINIYPETSYSDYARYVLGNHYLFTEQNDKAKEILGVLEKKKNFIYASEVNKSLLELAKISQHK